MLGINCLYRNAQLKDELQDLVEVYGSELIESDKVPTVGNVYRAIRTDGFEIDAQTVGHLYQEAFSDEIGSDMYSSESEILDFINEPYIKLLAAEAEDMKARGIGRNAPVQAVVSSLMNGLKMIEQANPTVQRIMQDRLAKGAKRVSGYKGEQSGVKLTTEDIIAELILINRNNKFSAEFSVMENAEIMWKEFKKEFSEVAKMLEDKGDLYNADKIMSYADLLENATYQLLMSTPEIQKVINDTLKEAGYKKQVGSKEVVDWNKVINDTTIDFRQVFKSVFRDKFNEKELSWIADEMDREFTKVRVAKTTSALESRNKGVTSSAAQKTALRKFTDLYNLGIFSASNQKALFRLLGVKETTEKQVKALERLGKVLSDAQNSPIEKWSDTFLKTLHREIEVITEMAEEGSDVAIKMARAYATYVQMSNALIISNPQNIVENTITGMNHLFMMTVMTQPGQFVNMMKVLWHSASDVAKGGVRTGNEEINTFNKIGHSEDRFNFETAKTPIQKVVAGINLVPRLLLSVADNSIKSAMMQQVGIDLLKKEIRKQGFNSSEANLIISEIFYGNRQQLEEIAKSFEEKLISSGVHASKGKWKRIADELAWANMETNGQFFEAIWSDLQSAGKLLGKELVLDDVLLKQIKNAAEGAASRSLGHRADNIVGEFIDRWAGAIGEDVSRARQEGHGLGRATAKQALYGQLTAFRYGGIRWMFLTYEKTGIGLLQTLITDVLFEKLGFSKLLPHALNKKYNDIDKLISEAKDKELDELIKIRGERMEWYAARKQRIVRNTIGTIQGYFTLMAFVFIAQSGGDDDDKKRALQRLAIDIAKDRSRNRWAQKSLPARVYNYLTSIARINTKTGKLDIKSIKYIEIPSDMEWYDFFLGAGKNMKGKEGPEELYQIFLNNMNDSKTMKLIQSMYDVSSGRGGSALGEAVAGAIATSPLKLYDMWSGAVSSQPIEKNKVKPETFLDGFIRQWATKDMFKNYMK